jgi:integrase
MSRLEEYLDAADRENTRRSYESGLRHFEIEWRGLLPATPDSVARYLADHGGMLSINTLRHRLAALSRWHTDQGFADPTKAPIVRQVLKGIRSVHPVAEKQARPLQLDALQQICDWQERGQAIARTSGDDPSLIRLSRDRALLLLGFWRGFRSDEIVHLNIENVEVAAGEGLTCYLPRTKGDRQLEGRTFRCPSLSRLCPVDAFEAWIAVSGLSSGPVFRKIDRWGRIGENGLCPESLIPLLRGMFARAGVADADEYSSHSLRRGFAGWAMANGWDLKELMAYVGWKDIKSAMRYLDVADGGLKARFERGLPPVARVVEATKIPTTAAEPRAVEVSVPVARIEVSCLLTGFSDSVRGIKAAQKSIEQLCFERYSSHRLDKAGSKFELSIPAASRDDLDETIDGLLDEMHRIASDNHCFLETSFHEPATGSRWN